MRANHGVPKGPEEPNIRRENDLNQKHTIITPTGSNKKSRPTQIDNHMARALADSLPSLNGGKAPPALAPAPADGLSSPNGGKVPRAFAAADDCVDEDLSSPNRGKDLSLPKDQGNTPSSTTVCSSHHDTKYLGRCYGDTNGIISNPKFHCSTCDSLICGRMCPYTKTPDFKCYTCAPKRICSGVLLNKKHKIKSVKPKPPPPPPDNQCASYRSIDGKIPNCCIHNSSEGSLDYGEIIECKCCYSKMHDVCGFD